jgi:hypothetical protein
MYTNAIATGGTRSCCMCWSDTMIVVVICTANRRYRSYSDRSGTGRHHLIHPYLQHLLHHRLLLHRLQSRELASSSTTTTSTTTSSRLRPVPVLGSGMTEGQAQPCFGARQGEM